MSARLTIRSQGLKRTGYWFRGVHGRHSRLSNEMIDEAESIIMNLAQYHTPAGKTYKLRDSWKRERVHQGVSVYNDDPKLVYVDQPTRPHVIRPRRKRALGTPYGPKGKVNHPGTKGHRFIRKIYMAAQRRIFRRFETKVNALLR